MQTVLSLAERLDMTAEEAVEMLRHMLFDVDGVESIITDEQCDLLIDIDDDRSIAERIRENNLKERQKAERRKKAAAKKAAAEKIAKKADEHPLVEILPPLEEPAPEATDETSHESQESLEPAAEIDTEPTPSITPVAEILPPVEELAEIIPPQPVEHHEPTPESVTILPEIPTTVIVDNIVPETETHTDLSTPEKTMPVLDTVKTPPAKIAAKVSSKPEEPQKPAITIGSAITRHEKTIQVVLADGSQLEAPEAVPIVTAEPMELIEEDEEEEKGLLAEAERRQEEEEKRLLRARPLAKPDPAVVAEVQRKAAERAERLKAKRQQEPRKPSPRTTTTSPAAATAAPASGKTQRKRMKKADRARHEEAMKREAAAMVKEVQAAGFGARKRKRRRSRDEDDNADAHQDTAATVLLEVEDSLTVEELASRMDVPTNELILGLMDLNILATKNQVLDIGLIQKVAEPYGFEIKAVIPEEETYLSDQPDDPADLLQRAPVITVMGHVDHGKTTLLDRIRKANVAEGEVGGITQHIAAYEVQAAGASRVVFLDTPGHEAFTQMRARGARVTDVVVLVVAADDGVMPQTKEAIDHARAAEVPIVVAVNKCDKPGAQPERIRQELSQYNLLSEEWGGKTVMKDISAKRGDGVDELMELLALEAELLELKANPNKRAKGTIIESEISRGQGPVAWVLVQEGTLRIGDVYLAGTSFGRVRSMLNSRGQSIESAGPATPVVVTGFNTPPDAGDIFVVLPEERVARSIADKRAELARQKQGREVRRVTLEDFHERLMSGEKRELHIIIKADVQGSVDVLQSSLTRLGNEEVRVNVVHGGVGAINESDVLLASASEAVIIGFHVAANPRAQKLAEQEGIDIHTYMIIYEAIDEIRKALEGMLAPESREVITGHAEIRQIYRSSAIGNIAGCFVNDGEIRRGGLIRILRDGAIVHEGKVGTLRRGKDDARSVLAGFECGIKIDNYDDIHEGDVIESFKMESVAKTLD